MNNEHEQIVEKQFSNMNRVTGDTIVIIVIKTNYIIATEYWHGAYMNFYKGEQHFFNKIVVAYYILTLYSNNKFIKYHEIIVIHRN